MLCDYLKETKAMHASKRLLLAVALICLTALMGYAQGGAQDDAAHTPSKGSAERQAIMDALRGDQKVVFQVHFLKVHHGWAWADVTPLDSKGKPTAEGGPQLLHFDGGVWKVMDLSKVPEDPDDPEGAEDASPVFVRNVRKTFPGVPADIFPKPSH
jgi:hypothetical protein